jgi:hypothetical protein
MQLHSGRQIILRISRLFVVCAFATLFAFLSVQYAHAATLMAPIRTLKIGDENQDVLLLQKILNATSSTMVAQTGIGSPGMETTFFGTKTFLAVKKFQALYANEILFQQNITAPTGYVGSATLRKLGLIAVASALSVTPSVDVPVNSTDNPSSADRPPTYSPVPSNIPKPIPLSENMALPSTVNPNTINLEYALATIELAGKKNGMSAEQIAALISAIRANAATTTDYRSNFFKSIKQATGTPPSLTAPTSIISPVVKLLSYFHIIEIADAAAGVPFGGRIFFTTPCTCSINTSLLIIEPLPPTYPALLGYVNGSQLYLNHNLPFASALLGTYIPGGQSCLMWSGPSCVPAPVQGVITPQVGSSLSPI